MVAVFSSNPTGGNFFFLLLKTLNVNFVQKCHICVENEKPECFCTYKCVDEKGLAAVVVIKKARDVAIDHISKESPGLDVTRN